MVYTKHFPIHSFERLKKAESYISNADKTILDYQSEPSHLDNLFKYIANDDKTMMKQLVSSYGVIDSDSAYDEFKFTKMKAEYQTGRNYKFNPLTKKLEPPTLGDIEKTGAVLARHLIQSFSPEDNLSAEQIHEIGRQTILEFTGGEYEFVIATHTDREHIHNHIILNTTNIETGKALPWKVVTNKKGVTKDVSKSTFEKVSDKIASAYGAKIIEKSPKTSHKKYSVWQAETQYKTKIKSRLDFLLSHSVSMDDFLLKADALNLSVDFSGKWATYHLIDEPQIKNTRGRNLLKSDPTKYNFDQIKETVEKNTAHFSVEDVVAFYEEKSTRTEYDFDYQITIDDWQVSHSTERGYYLNVDFGLDNQGKLFIGGHKVDKLEDGQYNLFVKRSDYFYFMNNGSSEQNKYMTGETLVRQLHRYNGQVPFKKEPIMTHLNELVHAINFLAEHDVHSSRQLDQLKQEFTESWTEANDTLDELSDKVMTLHQLSKLLIESDVNQQPDTVQKKLSALIPHAVLSDISYKDIEREIASIQKSQQLLKDTMTVTVEKIEKVHQIQAVQKNKTAEQQSRQL